jgi:hypothetical protein
MRVLFLNDNPNLGSTVRVLQAWLPLCKPEGVYGHVAARPGSKFV